MGAGIDSVTANFQAVGGSVIDDLAAQQAVFGEDFVVVFCFALFGGVGQWCPGGAVGGLFVAKALAGGVQQLLPDILHQGGEVGAEADQPLNGGAGFGLVQFNVDHSQNLLNHYFRNALM